MKIIISRIALFIFLIGWFITACEDSYTPKPRGYFRIDFPEKKYIRFDSAGFPYKFEYPVYADITNDPYAPHKKWWINLNFPGYKASLHISYYPVHNDLARFINDAHTLVAKHIPKADAIYDSLIIHPDQKVYGLAYRIEGLGAASPYQFYLTDSTAHYLRGALYFDVHPNNDSLEPVIRFLEADINHLIDTFSWQ